MLKLGLIGAGRWGRNYIKTLAALDRVRLTRVASRNPETRGLVPDHTRIDDDWRALIAAGDLDGVIIATPPATHAAIARAALAAGLPVLIEKPLTLDLREAQELRDLVRTRGVFAMVDHTHLFHPAFEELQRRLPELGALRAIRTHAGNHGPYRRDTPVLWDWGAHDVAMCIAVAGAPPQHTHAVREAQQPMEGALAETLRLELGFSDGLAADIRLSNMTGKVRRFAVYGARGALLYDDLAPHKLTLHPSLAPDADLIAADGAAIAVSPEPPLQRAVTAFAAAIVNRRRDWRDFDRAVEVVAVLERCARDLSAADR